MKHFGLIQDSNSNVPAPHRSAERGNLGNWIYWGSRLTIILYSTQNKKLNTPESGLITWCSSNVQFKFKSSRQCLWIIWPPYPNPIVVFGHCFFHRQTLHNILIQVRCLMSIYKDTKITFFWILFFWVQHILHSTSGDFFNCEEMGTHCECSFLINDRWKIYHRLVARWIYDIQLWPPNFIGWPLTIFAGWHPPLVDAEHNWKLISQQTTTNWNYCTHTIINQLIWMPNLFNT